MSQLRLAALLALVLTLLAAPPAAAHPYDEAPSETVREEIATARSRLAVDELPCVGEDSDGNREIRIGRRC
ncbi:MAG TPA: hypothetical protein VM582_09830 [Candidatus Thermoplasmatota archaeon]|nr:hypothetical protein [Candidatus Thermoplasmatota archaeon]